MIKAEASALDCCSAPSLQASTTCAWIDWRERLDLAVYAAYGWEYPLTDEEILSRLLALHLQRAAAKPSPSSEDTKEE